MHRIFIALLLLGAPLSQSQAQAPLTSFEFKGVRATDIMSQHVTLFGKCDKYFNFIGCKFLDANVGGQLAFPEAGWAPDGSLVLIRGSFSSFNYSVIREAFEAKWGKPASSNELPVQNGFGAKAIIPISVWEFAEGEMT